MGTFGLTNFANDDALDWVSDFLIKPNDRSLGKVLKEGDISSHQVQVVLAAAEVVAARIGHSCDDIPLPLREWAESQKKPASADLIALAVKRISELRSCEQFLREFSPGERSQWAEYQGGLLERLRREPRSIPKRTISKHSRKVNLSRGTGPLSTTSTVRFDRDDPSHFSAYLASGVTQIAVDVADRFTSDDAELLAKCAQKYPDITIRIFDTSGWTRSDGEMATSGAKLVEVFSHVRTLKVERLAADISEPLSGYLDLRTLIVLDTPFSKAGQVLARMEGLAGLSVFGKRSMPLQALEGLPHLQALRLGYLDCTRIDEISTMIGLCELRIEFLNELEALPSFAPLKKLERLSMSPPGKVVNLSSLLEASELRSLDVSGRKLSVESIRSLRDHPKLTEFRCGNSGKPEIAESMNLYMNLPRASTLNWYPF